LAAWGGVATAGVWIFQRGKKVGELQLPAGAETITQLLVFGSWIVASSRSRMEVWKSSTLEHYTTLYSSLGPGGFSGCISTMPTYLNKIFAGKLDGSVDIWNVNTGKLLYSIFPPADLGQVMALQPTPALSLIAIAYQSGPVVIHDVKSDTQVLSVNGPQDLAVTSISFRTDGSGAGEDGRKDGVMATASRESGDVTFWDLNNGGRKTGTLRGAHSPPPHGGISNIEFLPGQSVLLSSSMDNSLKSWIFDDIPFSPIPRALHARGGHSAPISTLQFLPPGPDGADDQGKWLLSSSEDRSLWAWSLRRDGQSTELSQGHIAKKSKKLGLLAGPTGGSELKAPRITCMACSMNRDGGMGALPGSISVWANNTKGDASTTGWESVVTGHEGDKFARTWFWGRKRAGRWKFSTSDGSDVTVGIPRFCEAS
jgi:U3 small nucleolar RNA-associated protein 21